MSSATRSWNGFSFSKNSSGSTGFFASVARRGGAALERVHAFDTDFLLHLGMMIPAW
jgi:hypothetical protein